jgi:glycerol-3-phosphate dehydrogenase
MSYVLGEVVWAVRNEMARTVEDVLARRLRVLFLNARIAIEMAPRVASIIALELKFDEQWVSNQVSSFSNLARQYLPDLHFEKSDKPVKIKLDE